MTLTELKARLADYPACTKSWMYQTAIGKLTQDELRHYNEMKLWAQALAKDGDISLSQLADYLMEFLLPQFRQIFIQPAA